MAIAISTPKAMPAIRRLIAKSGEIKRAFQYSWVKAALDDALIPAACRIGGVAATGAVTYSNAIYRTPAAAQNAYVAAASKCPIPSTVKKINGRNPINARFAGGFWRNGDPSKMPADWKYGAIPFTKKGFPDFSDHIHNFNGRKGDVEITITGNREADYHAADKALGLPPRI